LFLQALQLQRVALRANTTSLESTSWVDTMELPFESENGHTEIKRVGWD
jgi:hypothetical protein